MGWSVIQVFQGRFSEDPRVVAALDRIGQKCLGNQGANSLAARSRDRGSANGGKSSPSNRWSLKPASALRRRSSLACNDGSEGAARLRPYEASASPPRIELARLRVELVRPGAELGNPRVELVGRSSRSVRARSARSDRFRECTSEARRQPQNTLTTRNAGTIRHERRIGVIQTPGTRNSKSQRNGGGESIRVIRGIRGPSSGQRLINASMASRLL